MKKFYIRAMDSMGNVIEERITAETRVEVLVKIVDRQLHLIELKEEKNYVLGFNRVSLKEIALFFNQLAYVVGNGMNLLRGLKIIRNQIKNKYFLKVIDEIIEDVENGYLLSKAFEKHPKLFHSNIIFLIKAAEEGGSIEETLKRIAFQLENRSMLLSKVRGSLLYPAFIVLVMIGIIYFLLTYVIPALASTLRNFNADLPMITQLLIDLSEFLVNYYYYVLGGIGILIVMFMYVSKLPRVKRKIDFLLLKIPIIGKIIVYINIIEFSRTLSSLLNAGVPLNKGLENLVGSVSNRVIYESLMEAKNSIINEGIPLSNALGKVAYVPNSFIQIVSVGEESGNLPEMLDSLANQYEEELNDIVKNLIELINPMLMLVVAVVVGFIVFAMFSPIFKLMDQF